jgi:hypothetical protein
LVSEYESIFDDGSGAMKVHRGKEQKYFGMLLDFSHKGQCHVSMYDYVDGILEAFDDAVKKYNDGYLKVGKRRSKFSAATDNLFVVDEDGEKLSDDVAASFHTIVAEVLYVTKRARPDTCLAIAFLTTRVRAPDTDDWEKLCHLMEYPRGDRARPLILSGDNEGVRGMLMLHLLFIRTCVDTLVVV